MLTGAIQRTLLAHPEVTLAILFGSQATGRGDAESDVDIGVLGVGVLDAEQKMSLIGDLAEVTGRAVDLIDLRTAGEPMLGQVLQHGVRLIGSDEAYAELLRRHLFDAEDFLPYVNRMLAERRRAWIGS